MNKRERYLAFANFESVDRVPRRANYIPSLRETVTKYLGEDPLVHFDMDDPKYCGLRAPEGYQAPDYSVYFPEFKDDKEFTIDGNGCGHKGCGFYHFTERFSPLRNATKFEEIESYPFIDMSDWLDDDIVKTCGEARSNGECVMGVIGHMYESSWQVRGYEPFLMDLLTQRDWAEYILDQYKANNLLKARAEAKAGCDVLLTGDDVANQNALMFQPDLWREVFKPRWAEVYAAARDIKPDIHIWYHSDGNIIDIIDDLVEIGVTILNPVQPECMDPLAIRNRYGKKLAFDGCIGTQTTFPFGTVEDMRRTVTELATALDAKNGGLMLSPTHVLEPEVPPENIVAFFETCDKL